MASFPLDMTTTSLSMPERRASSIPYCRIGLSTSGSISFGMTFVAGKNRVPKPAQGKTQVRSVVMSGEGYLTLLLALQPHGSDIAIVVVKLFGTGGHA